MVELRAVSKIYEDGNDNHVVLSNVDFSIHDGDFITIMGESGCGKSTLLSVSALLTKPSSGSVYYDGKEVNFNKYKTLENYRREKLGLVFQNPNLISSLNVMENILLTMNRKARKKEKSSKILEYLEMVGIKDKFKSDVRSLSGGEAQRVSIVRAIINRPDILMCDEPTGALDAENSIKIIELLKKIREETKCALVVVTHDETIGKLGERRIVLNGGKLVESV